MHYFSTICTNAKNILHKNISYYIQKHSALILKYFYNYTKKNALALKICYIIQKYFALKQKILHNAKLFCTDTKSIFH